MLERIETLATRSVARGCGFAMLAIFTMMVGLSYEPALSLEMGGIFSLLVSLVLLALAAHAPRKPYRETELWLMLGPDERPPGAIAQTIVSRILRSAYLNFAYYFANGSCVLIVSSIVVTQATR
jgi:hypothetical protein